MEGPHPKQTVPRLDPGNPGRHRAAFGSGRFDPSENLLFIVVLFRPVMTLPLFFFPFVPFSNRDPSRPSGQAGYTSNNVGVRRQDGAVGSTWVFAAEGRQTRCLPHSKVESRTEDKCSTAASNQ
jgi:hypothetical protein